MRNDCYALFTVTLVNVLDELDSEVVSDCFFDSLESDKIDCPLTLPPNLFSLCMRKARPVPSL